MQFAELRPELISPYIVEVSAPLIAGIREALYVLRVDRPGFALYTLERRPTEVLRELTPGPRLSELTSPLILLVNCGTRKLISLFILYWFKYRSLL